MTRPLRVWCETATSRDHYLVALMQPLAWQGTTRGSGYQHSLLGSWHDDGVARIAAAGIDDCDVGVLAFGLEAVDEHPELWRVAVDAAARADAAGRVMLVFCHGDREIPAPGPTCVMLRTSMRAARSSERDVALPAWVADPDDLTPPVIAPYRTPPIVGFTGQAYPTGMAHRGWATRAVKRTKFTVRTLATTAGVHDALRMPSADASRARSIAALERSTAVRTDFLIRDTMTRLDLDRASERAAQQEFLERITSADYGLAVRGEGNYSYRLYETLAARRPAVTMDTDVAWPAASDVAWDAVTVFVRDRAYRQLGPAVAAFHAQVGERGWADRQEQCRAAWVRWLSAPAFLGRLVDRVQELVDAHGPAGLLPAAVAERLR